MISCDSIIENDSLFLRNLDTNSGAVTKDSWVSSTGYGFYNINYEIPLIQNHLYYFRANYKFTTTNQSPTWCSTYIQGGMSGTDAKINNPVANTEYTLSGLASPSVGNSYTLSQGQIYNGPSNAINGVTSYVKNSLCYDVTYLYSYLKAIGVVSSQATLKTWCNNNLEWKPKGTNYDISAIVADSSKIVFEKGNLNANLIECDGMEYYSINSTVRNNTYFDTGLPFSVYNNNNNGTVTHTRVSAQNTGSPFYPEHPYICKIVTNGSANPSCGGFVLTHNSAANKIFIERFVAKVPVGYTVTEAYNAQGDGRTVTWLTSRAGTGNWEEYAVLYKCGTGGTFSSGGHIYLTPTGSNPSTSVTWYVAYANSCDITTNEALKNYSALPNKDNFKGANVFSYQFNTNNFFTNGDGNDTGMTLPSGWQYDTTDIAGNAKASIVQPINTGGWGYVYGDKIPINPNARYKISYWVKCKQDMTSFLTAIFPYTSNDVALSHNNVGYVTDTLTKLTVDLTSGSTAMTVSSNANWVDRNYSGVGFRSNQYNYSYNNLGGMFNSTTGLIKGISGSNTVLFKTPYTGATITAGTYVVESYDGGNYPYPIQKSNLPTDNTWKYVEGYFGANGAMWDGRGGGWSALPFNTSYIKIVLNLYSNTGTVPIKFADIKVEEVGTMDGERNNNKIEFKKHS